MLHCIIIDYLDKHCLDCTPAAVLTAIREGRSLTMRVLGRWEMLFCANKAAWVMGHCVDVLIYDHYLWVNIDLVMAALLPVLT